jgi:hypothetical protein
MWGSNETLHSFHSLSLPLLTYKWSQHKIKTNQKEIKRKKTFPKGKLVKRKKKQNNCIGDIAIELTKELIIEIIIKNNNNRANRYIYFG